MGIEKKYTFEGQYETYAKRAAKLGPYGEMDVYKRIIEASGSSNKLVSSINTFTKYGVQLASLPELAWALTRLLRRQPAKLVAWPLKKSVDSWVGLREASPQLVL